MQYLAEALLPLIILVPLPKHLPEMRGFYEQTTETYQATFNAMQKEGWRLKRIRGYEKNGQSHFDSEWHKPDELRPFWSFHNITREEYDRRLDFLRTDGFAEILKSTWKVNGEERIWILWERK